MKKRLLAACVFGLLIYAILPARIAVVNDDFGYLRSVVDTIQHHRPWTDDWLEPWAVSLSVMSALIFRATGSFYLATYGLLAVSAAASFLGLATLLSARGFSGRCAIWLAAAVLTCATVLWKSLEFTSIALYLPCFFWALWAGERCRWGWFVVAWCVGIAARQSAIAWLFIPIIGVIAAFNEGVGKKRAAFLRAISAAIVGLAFFLFLRHYMNATHAQLMVTDQLLATLNVQQQLRIFLMGICVFCVGAGIGAFAEQTRRSLGFSAAGMLASIIGAVIALGLIVVDERHWVGIEHLCYDDPRGWLYTKIIVLVSAAGWLGGGFHIRWQYCVYGLASLALLSLRGAVWDYYFIDIALFGFLGIKEVENLRGKEQSRIRGSNRIRKFTWFAVAAFHLTFIFELKFALDRGAAVCALSEGAIREGRLKPEDISFTPFGFIGWYWDPYYIAHEGENSPDIGGFGCYLNQGAVEVGQAYTNFLHALPRFRHTPPSDRSSLIKWGKFRFAWFFTSQFFLLRAPADNVSPAAIRVRAGQFFPTPFPLNDSEWRNLIRTPLGPISVIER